VNGRVWKGTAFGGVKGRSELPGMVDQVMAGKLSLDDYISHRLTLHEVNQGFDLLHSGQSTRTVLSML